MANPNLAAGLPAGWVCCLTQPTLYFAVHLSATGDEITQITKTQLRVLTAIQQHLHTHGIPPSQRELSRTLGVALGGINRHIQNLRALGVLVDAPVLGRTTAPASGVRVVVTF